MTTTDLTREQILEMQAGRSLDALVAERVMGWEWFSALGDAFLFPKNARAIRGLTVHWTAGVLPRHKRRYDVENHYTDYQHYMIPSYSTDIAAAWSVVEKMRELGNVSMSSGPKDEGCDEWICRVHLFGYRLDSEFEAFAETAALAVCRVALLTKLTTPGNEG